MRAVIIGAGRGKRLEHLTDDIPKTMVPIVGRPMLDSILEALAAGGLGRERVVFVCGYKKEVIQRAYPDLRYVENEDWEHNNILLSLLCARGDLGNGFVSTYSDIVYRPEAITRVMASAADITLVCDTDWRRRYVDRLRHPESDAEKVRLDAGGRVLEVSRRVLPDEASGEFIGVMRLTARGAARFVEAFDQARREHGEAEVFREGRPFRKAYLVDLLQQMIEAGVELHAVTMHGGYMEIDTTEDARLAATWWQPVAS